MMMTRVTPFGDMLRYGPLWNWVDWPWEYDAAPERSGVNGPFPRFDVIEKDGTYEIMADLPGAKREDVKIFVNGKDLEVLAEVKKEEKQEEDGKLLRSERIHGCFHRRLTLAEEPDADRAKAVYQDGVLKITLPKSKNAKRKQLTVH